MNLDSQAIGTRIKARRKSLGITQMDIKKAVGISSGNMSEIENGNRLPSAPTLIQLANLLLCSVDWILTGESPKSENLNAFDAENANETTLLNGFRKLPKDEQDELLGILEMKLQKIQKSRKDRSYTCNPENDKKELA